MITGSNFLTDLSSDFAKLLINGDNHDVIIEAGEGENRREFRVHSLILCTRSTYFRTTLSKNWLRKEKGVIAFKKPNILSNIFEILLK